MARTQAYRPKALLLATAASFAVGAVDAAPVLQTVVGGVAGVGNGSIALNCTSFGPAPELSFHSFNSGGMPLGGIGNCGYVGGYATQTASAGPLNQSSSLPPVLIGSAANGSQFTGSADARSSYGALGAAAQGNMSVVPDQGSLALHQMAGAARFGDTLTATSARVGAGSAGSVRYLFEVDGSLNAAGVPAPFYFGETYVVLDVKHGAGPTQQLLNATVRRGSVGTISGNPPPAGWVTDVGSLSGGSTFVSREYSIIWGEAWDLEVGLLAWAYGSADSSFLGTAKLTGLEMFDALHAPVADFGISAASGTNYFTAAPEPGSAWLMLAGLLTMAGLARRQKGLKAASQHGDLGSAGLASNLSTHQQELTMAIHRKSSGGFTLIELLVVMAIIAVLLKVLLPDVSGAREAAANKVGKSALSDVLCPPPYCDALKQGVTLRYPDVPTGLTSGSALDTGLRITFDPVNIDQQPFSLHRGDTAHLVNPIDVWLGLDPVDFNDGDYALLSVAYTNPGVEYLVRHEADGTLWKANAAANGRSITFTAAAAQVPEPATWMLVLAAAAALSCKRQHRRTHATGQARGDQSGRESVARLAAPTDAFEPYGLTT